MKWEKFDHDRVYPDGEYVVEIRRRRREVVFNDAAHDELGWFNVWCDDDGDNYDQDHFTRILRLDLTDPAVEQAEAFFDDRFSTIN